MLSDVLRENLRKCGKTQRDIARLAGVPQSCVSEFFRGASINSDTLDRLERFLNAIQGKENMSDEKDETNILG